MKFNYKRRWEQIQSNLYDRDAFVASLPGNTRYLGNSEAPPGGPPSSTMNYGVIPKEGEPIAITSSLEEHRCRKEPAIDEIRSWTHYPDIKADGKTSIEVLKNTLRENNIEKIYADNRIKLGRSVKLTISNYVNEMRGVKTSDELERIKKAI